MLSTPLRNLVRSWKQSLLCFITLAHHVLIATMMHCSHTFTAS
jgi:hypothetical protein